MKRILLATTLVLGVTFAGAGAYIAVAAAATTPDDGSSMPDGAPNNPPGEGWGMDGKGPGMMMHHPGGPMAGRPHRDWHHKDDMFSLFARVQNKNLTPADVKIIAQAILLEHGNHDWTVTDVAAAQNAIDFSFATQHGDVIATFAVDPATGHFKRIS